MVESPPADAPEPSECRYHGAYVCPNGCEEDEPSPVARPQPGCSGGECQECGTEKEYVEVIGDVELPDHRHPFNDTGRLTEDEVLEALE